MSRTRTLQANKPEIQQAPHTLQRSAQTVNFASPVPSPVAQTGRPSPTERGTTTPTPPAQGPGCQVQRSTLLLNGGQVTSGWDASVGFFLRAGTGTIAAPGMNFSGLVGISQPGCGETQFVQNVIPFRQIEYKDDSILKMSTRNWHCDTNNPYTSQSVPTGDPLELFRLANDNPSQTTGWLGNRNYTEGLIRRMTVRDRYRMFLQFRPRSAAWQTLQIGEWSWSALAVNPVNTLPSGPPQFSGGGRLALDTSQSQIIPQRGHGNVSSENPTLSPNVSSVRFVEIPKPLRGQPVPRTYAHLFEPIVNGP
ncbi:MAG: hypothetical protein JEZ00_05320 [Anaerolineaceae bacterium]|nr:hypothetical protein [Anaerolineaceae bacterium]